MVGGLLGSKEYNEERSTLGYSSNYQQEAMN